MIALDEKPDMRDGDGGHVYVVPMRLRPQPWRHLWAWLRRTDLATYRLTSTAAARDAHTRADRAQSELAAEVQYRLDLAKEHHPKPWGDSTTATDFSCTACLRTWPCDTYKWATKRPTLAPLRLTEIEVTK